jgi:RNA polymerase sigma factor (sigma-70 family)
MTMAGRSDTQLLSSDVAEDFGLFYDRHLAVVVAFVARRASRPEIVFDIVAETFARALEHRSRYDPLKGPAPAWLIGIARNLMFDAARRGQIEARSRTALGMAPVELDDEQLAAVAERGVVDLRRALSTIPLEQREAIIRRVVLDEGYAEMADDLRCSEQVVRKRVSRGLARLRASLEAQR